MGPHSSAGNVQAENLVSDQIFTRGDGLWQRHRPRGALLREVVGAPWRRFGGVVGHLVDLGPYVSGVSLKVGAVGLALCKIRPATNNVNRSLSPRERHAKALSIHTSQVRNDWIPIGPR